MKGPWAIELRPSDAAKAWVLRDRSNLRACATGESFWLCGQEADAELERQLRVLPAVSRYTVDSAKQLTPLNSVIPIGVLPQGPWQRLDTFSMPKPQTACLPARLESRLGLQVVRTAAVLPTCALLTRLDAWCSYAKTVARARLSRLSFAASADKRVLVIGSPLPPLPGTCYAGRDGVGVPCGFGLSPDLGAAVVRDLLDLQSDDWAIFHEDGECDVIPAAAFVRASRSACRLTWRRYHEH